MNKILVLFTLAVIITYASVNADCAIGVDNCKVCLNVNNCKECNTNSYLITGNTCKLCSETFTNCETCDKDKCNTCKEKFTISKDNKSCVAFSSKIVLPFLALVAALLL